MCLNARMVASISVDLRKRVIDAYLAGDGTYYGIAERFAVSRTSVNRWLKRYREKGNLDPSPHGGGTKAKIDADGLELLTKLVQERPDTTLKELAESYEKTRAVKVANCIICRALKRLGLTRKKKIIHATERERGDVQLDRWFYNREKDSLITERLWFFDESGLNLSYARLFGRSPRGERAIGHVPKNWGDNVTLMAGIGCRGIIAPMMLYGSLTGDVFAEYVSNHVIPSIHPGDIIVMDNLAAHKTKNVITRIKDAGATLLYLPSYSPDLNPIEFAWSKLKTLIRGDAPRCMEQLTRAVESGLRAITNEDILSWIHYCGYGSSA